MKKFLVIYKSTVSAKDQMAHATPEQAKAGLQMWSAWMQKASKAIVDMGSPLGDAATLAGGKATPLATQLGGFGIVQGETREQLAALFADHPHLHAPGAAIEIHEVLALPGQ
ncbi:MAG: hypothetical protein ABI867_00325 [Kofleriaceae bacterium]